MEGEIRKCECEFGMAKFGVEKIWYQSLNTTAKFGTNSQMVAEEQADGEWWLPLPLDLWLVALISWRLLGTLEMCMPRALKMTPRKMASDLQIPWHNLAHFFLFIRPSNVRPQVGSGIMAMPRSVVV